MKSIKKTWLYFFRFDLVYTLASDNIFSGYPIQISKPNVFASYLLMEASLVVYTSVTHYQTLAASPGTTRLCSQEQSFPLGVPSFLSGLNLVIVILIAS